MRPYRLSRDRTEVRIDRGSKPSNLSGYVVAKPGTDGNFSMLRTETSLYQHGWCRGPGSHHACTWGFQYSTGGLDCVRHHFSRRLVRDVECDSGALLPDLPQIDQCCLEQIRTIIHGCSERRMAQRTRHMADSTTIRTSSTLSKRWQTHWGPNSKLGMPGSEGIVHTIGPGQSPSRT
jgi:hypothetical protein